MNSSVDKAQPPLDISIPPRPQPTPVRRLLSIAGPQTTAGETPALPPRGYSLGRTGVSPVSPIHPPPCERHPCPDLTPPQRHCRRPVPSRRGAACRARPFPVDAPEYPLLAVAMFFRDCPPPYVRVAFLKADAFSVLLLLSLRRSSPLAKLSPLPLLPGCLKRPLPLHL